MNDDSHPKWDQLSASLRKSGLGSRPAGEDLSAPHGFASRVVSRYRADERADATGLALWRRWSLAGAACALLLFGGAFLVEPAEDPAEPIIPVPALESELPKLAKR